MGFIDSKRAVIIGAGPAGLTAAHELLTRTGIKPIILEKSSALGGISQTVNYKGNRIDIGGHRFFSKSDRVMEWWSRMLPIEASENVPTSIKYHGMERKIEGSFKRAVASTSTDNVMLVRARKSRIYYLRRFFDYPITLSKNTVLKLGLWRTFKIGLSYIKSALFPLKVEQNLEQFFINRFGRELYGTFFKSYTEKVWGVPCKEISAEWGAQRIKGLSVWSTLKHAFLKLFQKPATDISQKKTETSLIEQFLYPKFGPGQVWEEVARQIVEMGGEIHKGVKAERLITDGWQVKALEATNADGERVTFSGDYFFSTAPIQEIMRAFDVTPPKNVLEVSDGLVYRDFITVGLLVGSLKISDQTPQGKQLVRDNWIYIQEPDVMLGRLQIFNNWSPYMVADQSKVWLGLEYFCNEKDDIWKFSNEKMVQFATEELSKIGIIEASEVLDATVLRMEKTYPAYFGTYDRFAEIREYVDRFENLFLVGRNGMHRYNNQDHSMLTAMMSVDNIIAGNTDKVGLWEVNTEMDYHEEKASETESRQAAVEEPVNS